MNIAREIERFLIEESLIKLTDWYSILAAKPLTEDLHLELAHLEARICQLLKRLESLEGADQGSEKSFAGVVR